MLKLGFVCSLVLLAGAVAIGCGDDDGGGGNGGGTLCEQQQARAMNECGVTVPNLGTTSDAGVSCTGQPLCIATCAQNSSCADLVAAQQFMGPFLSCTVACLQQPAP